jgi:neuroligin
MLFQRAILMSGSSLSPWALVPEPSRFARHVAKYVNCSSDLTDTHLLKCLRERPLESLLAVPSPPIHTTENGGTTPGGGDFASSAFGPSVDGVVIDAPPPLNNAWVGVQRGPTLSGSSSNSGDSNSNSGGGGGSSTSTSTEDILRKKYIDKLGRYDLLFGVVRAEAYFAFAAEDIQYGIESERRGKLLRAFVRDTYR